MTRSNFTSKYMAIFIGLLPLLNYYRIIGTQIKLSIVLMMFSLLLLFFAIIKKKLTIIKGRLPIIIYIIYIIVTALIINSDNMELSNWSDIIILIVVFILIITNNEIIDKDLCYKIITLISIFAAILISFQYATHYFFDQYFTLIPRSLLISENQKIYSIYLINGVKFGLFRPAAFFLEPAHLAEYSIVGLVICLFREPKPWIWKAIIISLGILFTTSSMGLGLILICWLLFMIQKRNIKLNRYMLKVVIGGIVFIIITIILIQLPIAQKALARVFTGDYTTSAIYGRVGSIDLFSNFDLKHKIFGMGYATEPEYYGNGVAVYLTGMSATLYRLGISGLILFYVILIKRFIHSYSIIRVLIFIFAFLYVVAAMHGVFSLLFYFTLIFLNNSKNSEISVL